MSDSNYMEHTCACEMCCNWQNILTDKDTEIQRLREALVIAITEMQECEINNKSYHTPTMKIAQEALKRK